MPMFSMLRLLVTPVSALADEFVHIRATGLSPLQLVTLTATLKDELGNLFQSRAFYRANRVGEVDLKQASSLGGDYTGVHPMGLFWSLKPEKPFKRLIKRDVVNSPFLVTLDIYDSICLPKMPLGQPRDTQVVQRWFFRPGMQRVQIREGCVRGALFLPPGEGPFPGIIDLFGGVGGLVEFRASLLATHGFAVLAVAYFGYEDLPERLAEIDLEYFEEAANLLLSHPKVQGPGIGVISVSKGAEIGLAMACFLKQVVALICINGANAIYDCPLKYKDLVMTPALSFRERAQTDVSGAVRLLGYRGDPWDKLNRQSVFPIEKAKSQILFIVGEDDQSMNSREFAKKALEQLNSYGKSNGRMLVYPGAGHLIEPPYAPLCYASRGRSGSMTLLWGGDPVAHAAAQEHAWGEIQKFFRQHLTQTRSQL